MLCIKKPFLRALAYISNPFRSPRHVQPAAAVLSSPRTLRTAFSKGGSLDYYLALTFRVLAANEVAALLCGCERDEKR